MELDDLRFLLTTGISASIGASLGILRSKLFATKVNSVLYYFFYILAIILFLFAVYTTIIFWKEAKIIVIVAFISSVCLAAATKYIIVIKDTYTTSELDPIVNKWTSNGDRNEIKLFGGDLSFFGGDPTKMSSNSQYSQLCDRNFNHVLILCEAPNDNIKRIRYGKILIDIPGAELRFYNPEKADLRVRGRIIKVQGADKLLVYTKVKSGIYQAIETDTGNTNGALYSGIWDLIWDLAKVPSPEQIDNFKQLYQER